MIRESQIACVFMCEKYISQKECIVNVLSVPVLLTWMIVGHEELLLTLSKSCVPFSFKNKALVNLKRKERKQIYEYKHIGNAMHFCCKSK